MKQITGLTDNPKMQMYTTDDDGKQISLTFVYRPRQMGWFVDVSCVNFKVNGIRISAFPNILNKFSNNIRFGLSCQTTDGYDPYFLSDFKNGRASFFVLSNDEKEKVAEYLSGQV